MKALKLALHLVLIAIAILLIINLYVFDKSKPYIFSVQNAPEAYGAIVLGASVYSNGKLTPVLEDRVVTAAELYKAGKVKKILASGDNTTKNYNEVVPMHDFLLHEGVPEQDILTDFNGINTFESVSNAKRIFGDKPVLIVTERFHLSRAVFIARDMGLHANGVAADSRPYYFRNYIREFFAVPKAVMEVMGR